MTKIMETARYKFFDVGLSGLFFQRLAIVIAPHLPAWVSANKVTSFGALICLCILITLREPSAISGALILFALLLDFLDGTIARYRGTASHFGKILDGTVDLLFWLGVLLGLYISGAHALTVGLLVIYTIDLYWRWLLGHSTSITDHGGERYKRSTSGLDFFHKMKPYVYPLANYYDSVTALSLILIVSPQYVEYWLWYEILRRSLLLFKKLVEICHIYANDRA